MRCGWWLGPGSRATPRVQIALIDVLVDAGAAFGLTPNDALVNSNFAAAAHLVERGAAADARDGALPRTLARSAERLMPSACS